MFKLQQQQQQKINIHINVCIIMIIGMMMSMMMAEKSFSLRQESLQQQGKTSRIVYI